MSHTPIQDIEKVFKFYTVKSKKNNILDLNFYYFYLACCSYYES